MVGTPAIGAIMENAIGHNSIAARQEIAAQNSRRWTSRIKLFALWMAVIVPTVWGIVRAFDGVGYLIPQG
jgi:hypothetical protein